MDESVKQIMSKKFLVNTESAYIEPDEVTVENIKCNQIHQAEPKLKDDYFVQKIIDADTLAKTRKRLDAAIVSAWNTVKSNRRPPALTPIRWVWRLAGFYHLCHSTPQLMKEAQERFALANRYNLAQWAGQKSIEEAGHDLLALLDIQSMGYKPEAVVEVLLPPAAKTLVDSFTRSVQDSDPIDCVGYSYTAERLGICVGEAYVQSVEALLPSGIRATRCLRAHSAVSTEVKHVKESLVMIAGLTSQEIDRIVKACYEAALLRFSPPKQDYISDDDIEKLLQPLKI
ncbi:hypothetical protein NIES23_64140 (plasmid) [Trichormus variabilis NIES-23]|uniref:Uncharacterized protein n=1 Tax=Trichormus variabilis NIES-23 TaxID=1973479 RepID=A0A1Z4KXE1_ANAVA|nr:hypothetical protein NIES23_64140 [Trichormus variabilis NIES-23]